MPSKSDLRTISVKAVQMEPETDGFWVWSERLREWQMVRVALVTVMRWYVQDEVNQEESDQNEVQICEIPGKYELITIQGLSRSLNLEPIEG